MEISESSLMNEVDKVIEDGAKKVFFRWTVEFKIKDTFTSELPLSEKDKTLATSEELEDKIYKPIKVLSIDTERDYQGSYGDFITTRVLLSYGSWVKVLFLAREHLYCTITRVPLTENTKEIDPDQEIISVMYDCIPQINGRDDLHVETSRFALQDKFFLDSSAPPVEVDFELLDRGLELTRKITMGATIRKKSSKDVINGLLAAFTKDLEIEEGKAVEKISVVKPDNNEIREHYLIPHGTKLLDVPNYLQDRCGGVYSTGLNTYYQSNQIYVYPLANLKRFDEEEQTLTVIKVPENRFEEIERTFKLDDKRLTILANSENKFGDNNRAGLLRDGNGLRFADSRKFMNKIVETKDNKSTIKRKDVNHEYLSVSMDKLNNITMSETRIHSNPYKEYSKQAMKDGGLFTFVWKHADINLLYPGMPVKVLYNDQENLKEILGVLLKVHGVVQSNIPGLTPSGHYSQATLFIYAAMPGDIGN